MRFRRLTLTAAVACSLGPWMALGANATSDDRISVSADGATLTGTNGGGGASLGWLHNFEPDILAGIAVEHQTIGSSQWTFGSVNGALSSGPDNQRYGLYAEAHEGAGDDPNYFHYRIEAAGLIGTFAHRLSAQLEDRQIDVQTTHGNLPKVGMTYLWDHRILTSASYQYSVSGNLGTRLWGARIDEYGKQVNLFAGGAWGQASAAVVLNFQTGLEIPGRQLHEGYVGAMKPFPHVRGELTLVADYQDLSGIKHVTLTLAYIFHVGATGTAR